MINYFVWKQSGTFLYFLTDNKVQLGIDKVRIKTKEKKNVIKVFINQKKIIKRMNLYKKNNNMQT